MVRAVEPAPCLSRGFVRRPEAGCLRAAEHEPQRK
jgi:hypothetical protein